MDKGDFIFVYGTLRKGERADLSKQTGQFGVTYIGLDAINGGLYHLGSYPGVKAAAEPFDADKPLVHGEVFLIRDLSIVSLLDAYEGYPHLYDRIQIESAAGRKVWVYIYQHPVTSDQQIQSGDWVKNRDPIIRTRGMA